MSGSLLGARPRWDAAASKHGVEVAGLIACGVRNVPRMDLHFDMEFQGGLLLVTASGNLEVEATLRLFKQACDIAKEKGTNKILVNGLAVDGELSVSERYRIGVEIAAYVKQRQMNTRLAIVGRPPTMNGLGVLVAQNRDLVTNAFSSQEEALNWLHAWPG
jgi:hypothetical protein